MIEKEFLDLTDSLCVRAVQRDCDREGVQKEFLDLIDSQCVRAVQRDCDREGVPRFD